MRPAKWSMVVLKTCAANGASGAAFRRVRGERAALEVLAEELVVRLGRGLDEAGAEPLGVRLEVRRDLPLGPLREGLPVGEVGLHRHEVDEAGALAPLRDGEVDGDGLHLERALDVRDRLLEVALLVVHPAHHADRGPARVGEHVVGPLGPVVGAVHGRDREHGAVGDLERPLDLGEERGEARAVEDVEPPPALLEGLRMQRQREVPLLLLRLGVEARGRALGRRPLRVGDAEQRLDERGLAGAVGAQHRERADHAGGGHVVVVSGKEWLQGRMHRIPPPAPRLLRCRRRRDASARREIG